MSYFKRKKSLKKLFQEKCAGKKFKHRRYNEIYYIGSRIFQQNSVLKVKIFWSDKKTHTFYDLKDALNHIKTGKWLIIENNV